MEQLRMIYVIGNVDTWRYSFIKIGYSKNDPMKRLQALQTGSPFKLKVIHCMKGSIKDEAAIHNILKEYRTNGEWFECHRISDDKIDFLLGSKSAQDFIEKINTDCPSLSDSQNRKHRIFPINELKKKGQYSLTQEEKDIIRIISASLKVSGV